MLKIEGLKLAPGESEAACFYWGLGYEEVAAATSAIVPVVILFIVGQKYFVEGIATSGVKG